MNYTKIKERTEYDPLNVYLFNDKGDVIDTFKAVFKLLSAPEFEELLKKVRDEDNGPEAIQEIVIDNLIRYEGIVGVPEEVTNEQLMIDMQRDGRNIAATWGCLRDHMLDPYNQNRNKKKSKGRS